MKNYAMYGLAGIAPQDADKIIALIQSLTARGETSAATAINAAIAKAGALPGEGLDTPGRIKYLNRLSMLPAAIQQDLLEGRQQIVDHRIYSVVACSATATVISDLFAQDAAKATGIRNIANQKLDADRYFLLTAIQIMFGIDASASGAAGTYSTQNIPDGILNGEIELSQNSRKILPLQPASIFDNGPAVASAVGSGTANTTAHTVTQKKGIYVLDNPKWILPQEELKAQLKLGAAHGLSNGYIKIVLHGVINERS